MTQPIERPILAKDEAALLVQLLRFLGKGPAEIAAPEETGDRAAVSLRRAGTLRQIARTTLHAALSRGLIRQQGAAILPTPEAAGFLKRALVKERDEIFLEQHRDCGTVAVDIDGEWSFARLNQLSSPLQALYRLREKDGAAYFHEDALAAGERLARDFHRGHLSPRVSASFEPRLAQKVKGQKSHVPDLTDAALAARLRFTAAAEAMGPELCGVAIDICCFEKGLEAVERERHWPARSAKLMLRTALAALVRHYAPPQDGGKRRSHHWGADDYRPSL